jgi:hypothetical protein
MQDWLKQNAWTLIVTLVGMSIAWATLGAQVNAISTNHERLEARLDKIDDAILRITVLEEHDKNIGEDISEIKGDIKDIKLHFQIKP